MPDWCPTDLLPGLWNAALLGALALLLHRLYDRFPRTSVLLPAAAGVLALAFGPVLFGGRVLLPLDSLRARAPFTELAPTEPHGNPLQGDLLQLIAPAGAEARRAFGRGRWPLTNPYAGAGMPLLGDPQAQVLQPLTAAAYLFDVPRAAGVTAALRVGAAWLFTFLFLFHRARPGGRSLSGPGDDEGRVGGLTFGAALVGSTTWALGGFLMLWLGWPLANTAAWLPAVLYAAARLTDGESRRRDLILCALTLYGLLTAGHPETIVYSLGFTTVFVAVRLATGPRGGTEAAPVRERAFRLAGTLALAAALAAPALLPGAAALSASVRAERLGTGGSAEPVAPSYGERAKLRLAPLIAPNTFGNDRYAHYWGGENINEDASGFVGTAALLLVLAGFAVPWRSKGAEERFLLFVLAGGLYLVAQGPGVTEILDRLPGGSASGYHHRLLLLVGFALAWLAALEVDRRTRPQEEQPGRARALGRDLAVVGAALALGAFLFAAYRLWPHPEDPERLDVLRRGWLHWQGRFLVGAALALLIAGRLPDRLPRLRRLPSPRRLLGPVLAAALAAELLLLHLPAYPPVPKDLAFPTPPALSYLLEHQRPGERLLGTDRALLPNLATYYGLRDVRIYNPAAPAGYLRAAEQVIESWEGELPLFGKPERPFYDRLSVRYVLTPPASAGTDLETPTGRQPPAGWQRIFDGPSGTVWERPSFLPLAFLTAEKGEKERTGEMEITEVRPTRLTARFAADGPRLLGTSLHQDGGWRVLVDGRRVPAGRDEDGFVRTRLPPGENRRLTLLYRPPGFLAGCLLAGLGLAVGLVRLAATGPHRSSPSKATATAIESSS